MHICMYIGEDTIREAPAPTGAWRRESGQVSNVIRTVWGIC